MFVRITSKDKVAIENQAKTTIQIASSQGPLLVPPGVRPPFNEMPPAVQLPTVGKGGEPTFIAASSDGYRTSRLIDTGSDFCVFPRTRIKGRTEKCTYEIYAANGTTIGTYGVRTLNLDLGLRRAFE